MGRSEEGERRRKIYQRARGKAWAALARKHPTEYRMLLEEEMEREEWLMKTEERAQAIREGARRAD